jgi:hypothetical protein
MTLAESETSRPGPPARANGAAPPSSLPPTRKVAAPEADDAEAARGASAPADGPPTQAAAMGRATRAGSGGRIGQRRLAPRDMPAVKAEARRLIEGTTLSAYEIARQLDIADSTVCNWKKDGGWTRPEGAPTQPDFGGRAPRKREPRDRHADMVTRLYRVFDRQTADLEARAAQPGASTDEKDARTLSVLARTLDILKALDRDDGAKTDAPEPADRERFNAELARRIRRWAEGRSGT